MLTTLTLAASLLVHTAAEQPKLLATGAIEEVRTYGQDWPFGGMSGIDRAPDGTFRIICDDRAKLAPARIASTTIRRRGDTLTMGTVTWGALLSEKRAQFRENTVDAEDVRVLDDGAWVWSSEGRVKDGVPPMIFRVDPRGVIQRVEVPQDYLPDSKDKDLQTRGVRHNRGFEAIATSGPTLITAPEAPLTQDESSGITRLQVLHVTQAATTPIEQLAYTYGPNHPGYDVGPKNGVVSMLLLDPERLLVLERGEPKVEGDSYDVRLYVADLSGAPDITGLDDPEHDAAVRKSLVLDFEDIRDQLPNGRVPNFEGMCLAPKLGGLLLIADNDHGDDGPTILALLSIPELGIENE